MRMRMMSWGLPRLGFCLPKCSQTWPVQSSAMIQPKDQRSIFWSYGRPSITWSLNHCCFLNVVHKVAGLGNVWSDFALDTSIYLSTHLPKYLSIYLSTYLPTYLPIYPSIHPSIYLSIYRIYTNYTECTIWTSAYCWIFGLRKCPIKIHSVTGPQGVPPVHGMTLTARTKRGGRPRSKKNQSLWPAFNTSMFDDNEGDRTWLNNPSSSYQLNSRLWCCNMLL